MNKKLKPRIHEHVWDLLERVTRYTPRAWGPDVPVAFVYVLQCTGCGDIKKEEVSV